MTDHDFTGRIGTENLSGPGAIGVAPDLTGTALGGADMPKRTCSIAGCNKPHYARGWCNTHYHRWNVHGDPDVNLWQRGVCSIEGCNQPHHAKGLCSRHAARKRRYGDPLLGGRERIVGDDQARFNGYVDRNGPVPDYRPDLGPCWLWTGTLVSGGYGQMHFRGRHTGAHRVAYELLVGPIPEGLTIDHLCRVVSCVNPAHLEPVTMAENLRRAGEAVTHCPAGHEYDEANTYRRATGRRLCRACARESQRRRAS